MAIKSIVVVNVMAFQTQWRVNNSNIQKDQLKAGDTLSEAFHLDFCDGINIIMGENGMGKTSLLKMIYAATQWSIRQTHPGKTKKFADFFSDSLKDTDLLKNREKVGVQSYFEVSDGMHKLRYGLYPAGISNLDEWLGLEISSIFIPTTEMLSHADGFLALNEKYHLPFDGTQVDIVVNASLPEAKQMPDYMEAVLERISNAIGGTVIMEDGRFLVQKKQGVKIDFSLEAEGLRKLGLLWKLIRNGLLEKGTILLWDEPEANLNPELFPLVVDILFELQQAGVQIFIATHSYNLAKYFEIRRNDKRQVLYHNLFKAESEILAGMTWMRREDAAMSVCSNSAMYLSELPQNKIMDADEKLLDEAMKKSVGE